MHLTSLSWSMLSLDNKTKQSKFHSPLVVSTRLVVADWSGWNTVILSRVEISCRQRVDPASCILILSYCIADFGSKKAFPLSDIGKSRYWLRKSSFSHPKHLWCKNKQSTATPINRVFWLARGTMLLFSNEFKAVSKYILGLRLNSGSFQFALLTFKYNTTISGYVLFSNDEEKSRTRGGGRGARPRVDQILQIKNIG